MGPDRRKRLLAVTAIVCVGAFIADRLVVSPLQHLWGARADRVAELEASLRKGSILVGREEAMRTRWQEMRERSLAPEMSVAEDRVLKSVGQWARESHLGVTSLKPRWIDDNKDVKELEFRATAQGRMGSIARFLYELETDPLPLKVEDVVITARDDRGEMLTLGIRFTALVLMDEEG